MISPLSALLTALGLVAGLVILAFAVAAAEWMLWRAAARAGLPTPGVARLDEWIGGLGGLAHSGESRSEPPASALGFALVAAGSVFPLGLLLTAPRAALLPAGLGVLSLSPLVSSLGYAVAAERAPTPESARHRLATASRILFAAPAWLAAVAVAAQWAAPPAGSLGAGAAWVRAGLAVALIGSGLLILPGTVAERPLASRPWGGDAREPSRAVRFLTGAAHYTGLCSVCLLAAWMTGAPTASRPSFAGLALAATAALVLRLAPIFPRGGHWLRDAPRWLVPVLLAAYCARSSFLWEFITQRPGAVP